ncbi:hypothetical protein [Parapedobacter sp. 10938]|uniref:hypothetical protein n=1 Tax=Parapedobacter flavus TaxID=3110225 RepID=UPI002DBFD5FA|nr:hypothetical protein [Parapedobacter sp. 10938]MEC3880540.1 hypothetical protein [Parapedobacter sp. 10938]
MKIIFWKISALLLTLGFIACGKGDGPTPDPDPPGNGGGDEVTTENVTYTNFAGSLLQTKCSGCHAGSGEGTSQWVLSGFNSVKDNIERINDAVIVRRVMPKNGSLSTRERELLKAWIDKGAPQ